ncbi:MAG: AarF/ABC1/UbiB kinase family protein [Desulfovibrionaceae bacterium]|jgi:ubiquinone biosynthesis protein|nr:AarF/ABC1/UbiB kinase family protein [Desulfovibrionaceae bacterium]
MSVIPGAKGLARINRVREIGFALAKYGFHDVVAHLGLPLDGTPDGEGQRARTTYERIRRMLEELGPTFIKLGQVCSVRPDLVPEGLLQELRKLQHLVEPLPFARMEERLAEELGRDWREAFATVEEESLASASLAQVHGATLPDGTRVALKILKPGIRKVVDADLGILRQVAEALQGRVEALAAYDLPAIVDELGEMLLRELDLTRELRGMRAARLNLRGTRRVFVPRVYGEHSTHGLLVMERVEGVHLGAAMAGEEHGLSREDRRELARTGLSAIIRQILEDGFFHADPHPGNILLCPDGRMALLDWGMTGRLTRRLRNQLVDLVWAMAERDAESAARVLCDMARPCRREADAALERDVLEVLDLTVGVELESVSLGQVMLAVSGLLRRHGLRMPPDLAVMIKALVTAEGTARMLYPELDAVAEAHPLLRRITLRRKGPLAVLRQLGETVAALAELHRVLPGKVERIATDLESGRLTIRFRHEGLEGMRDTLASASSRVALAVVLAAIFLGSSLIMTTGMQPHILGYPAFGVVGYIVSGALGIWLAVTIIRGRRF